MTLQAGTLPHLRLYIVGSSTLFIMKRYLAFYGDCYYAGGGMNDFITDCDTIEDCETAIKKAHIKNRPDDLEWEWAWKQIYDTEKREMVVDTFD